MLTDTNFIITPDKVLGLAKNYVSRYGSLLTYKPEDNIIFIKSDFIEEFEHSILPNITYRFILLTHDSDIAIESKHLNILNNQHLIKWFGMNCHIIHDKLIPIPIGMANEVWPHGNKETMLKVINENNTKDKLVYCNFDITTNFTDRNYALQSLRHVPFIDFETQKLPFEEYLRKLSTYKYVISPPGNSVDCHRIWESIYLKTIPICLKQIPLVSFKTCPILFINDWGDITIELLESRYKSIMSDRSAEKSLFTYYNSLITKFAQQ